jgi:hypothetical protein
MRGKQSFPVRAELVEALPFQTLAKEGRPFARLRANGGCERSEGGREPNDGRQDLSSVRAELVEAPSFANLGEKEGPSTGSGRAGGGSPPQQTCLSPASCGPSPG